MAAELQDDNIRLLKLLPDESGLVRLRTSVVSLSEEPRYTALSYTWGRPPDGCRIELDGRQVLIRKNLWRFFRQINNMERGWSNLLWIDSICIDQDSDMERTHQIRLMSQIYSHAEKVIVWLGPAHSQSDQAIKALKDYNRRHRMARGGYKFSRGSEKFWNGSDGIAVTRLCQRAYWTRLWVFQEIILAKRITIICGSSHLDWYTFRDVLLDNCDLAWGRVERNIDYRAILRSPAMSIVQQTVGTNDRRLWTLMMRNRDLQCSEPKDKIFGLLGVAKTEATAISPDYRLSLCYLLNMVLELHHEENPPTSIETVAAECQQLTSMFGLPEKAVFEFATSEGLVDRPQVNRAAGDCPLGDPNILGITGWWALFYDRTDLIPLLYQATPNRRDLLTLAWQWAEMNREEAMLCFLLNWTVLDPNTLCSPAVDNSAGATDDCFALERAIRSNCPTLALMLIEKGARLDAVCAHHNGETAITAAAEFGQRPVLQALLDREKRIPCRHEELQLSLKRAAVQNHRSTVELLLDYVAKGGIWYDVRPSLMGAFLRGLEDMALPPWYFPWEISNVKIENFLTGWWSGREDTLRLLLDYDAGGHKGPSAAHPPLQTTSERDYKHAVCILLEYVTDTEQRSATKHPLVAASQDGREDIVQLLIEYGVNVNEIECVYEEASAFASASQLGYGDTGRLRPEHGADIKRVCHENFAILSASRKGHTSVVQLLLAHGADLNQTDLRNDSALGKASQHGHEDIVQLLLDHGAVVDTVGHFGRTPLMLASYSGHFKVVKRLLEHGADWTLEDHVYEHNALQFASSCGHQVTMRLLEAAQEPNGNK